MVTMNCSVTALLPELQEHCEAQRSYEYFRKTFYRSLWQGRVSQQWEVHSHVSMHRLILSVCVCVCVPWMWGHSLGDWRCWGQSTGSVFCCRHYSVDRDSQRPGKYTYLYIHFIWVQMWSTLQLQNNIYLYLSSVCVREREREKERDHSFIFIIFL